MVGLQGFEALGNVGLGAEIGGLTAPKIFAASGLRLEKAARGARGSNHEPYALKSVNPEL